MVIQRAGLRRLAGLWAIASAAALAASAGAALAEPPPRSPSDREAPRASQERTVDLRPKFRVGRDIRYQFELTSANRLKSSALPEIDGDQTLTQSILLKVHPVEVSEEGTTVELSYEKIKATLETADYRATFDSSKPAGKPGTTKPSQPGRGTNPSTQKPGKATNPAGGGAGSSNDDMSELLAEIMRPMVGTKLTMMIDKDGNIKSVSGGEALSGSGVSGLEGLVGGGGKGIGGAGLGIPMPTAGGGGGSGGPMSWVITGPAQKSSVRVGETWTNNDSLSGTPVGGFTMVTKHTCKSAGATSANFSFSGRADAQSSGQQQDGGLGGVLGGFALKESNYGGTYVWDTGRGELKEMNSTLNTRIEQRQGGQGQGEQGSTQLTGETKVNVRRLD